MSSSVIDQFSHFDAPTGFAAAANSATAGLNDRKEFLTDLGVLNRIGLKQDGVTVTDAGDLRIDGLTLGEIDDRLRERGAGSLTVLPTAAFRRSLGTEYPRLSRTELRLINPSPVPQLLGDKALQYWTFYETGVPVPPWQPIDHYLGDGRPAALDAVADDFIAGAPLVLKARSATQGRGIWFYPGGIDALVADWRRGAAPEPFLDTPGEYLLQYAVPHDHDKRVLAAGETVVSGERRYGSPDTDKSNLNLVDLDAASLREAATELLDLGAVEPLDVDPIDPAVERAVADTYRTLTGVAESGGDRLYTWVGWDFLVVDPEDDRLAAVPDDVLQGLLDDRYRTRRGNYLVFGEGNLSPGSKERYVNLVARGREGLRYDSAANLVGYGRSISRGETFEPGVPDGLEGTLVDAYGLR